MTRALFISIVLHSLAIAIVFALLNKNSYPLNQSVKEISLLSVKIAKPTVKKTNQPKKDKQSKNDNLPRIEPIKEKKIEEVKSISKLIKYSKPIKKLIKPKTKLAFKKPKKYIKKKKKVKHIARKKVSKKQHKHAKKSAIKSYKKDNKKRSKVHKLASKTSYKKRSSRAKKHSSKIKRYHKAKPAIKHTKRAKEATTLASSNIKAQVYRAINQNKVSPRLARKLHLQGSVYTCFTLSSNKKVRGITTQGAHPILQKGARESIQKAKYYFPNISGSMSLCVTISYISL